MKKNKTALLTVFGVNNYGSMLQSYAMQQTLFTLKLDNEIINYSKKSIFNQIKRLFNKTLLKAKLAFVYRSIYGKYIDKELGQYFKRRDLIFNEFSKNKFVMSEYINNREALIRKMNDYDNVVVGSDQVWNPTNFRTDYYTMTFVPDNINKVAYASSFGVSHIPKNQIEGTKKYLSRINSIGVREITGQKIIKELLNRDVEVVSDPTLLLSVEDWNKIKTDKRIIEGDYIICYFLGSNKGHRDFVNKLKEKTGYQIATIPHCDGIVKADLNFGDLRPDNIGPCEFLNLIANAKFVCTDSFHCCIFSILYKKQFYVFNRFDHTASKMSSTNSRIDSLLTITNLQDRLINSYSTVPNTVIDENKFSDVDMRLLGLKERSLIYLKEALHIK